MTTKRKHLTAIERFGVNHVRAIVEGRNCIFQEIDRANDIGNDAYIEFIDNEAATGCCIAVQIKTGVSYVSANGEFVLGTDRDHFEYWSSHVLPVAGIVVDPQRGIARWCDVTGFLRDHPRVVENGPFRIIAPSQQSFSATTFGAFREYFMRYSRQYSDDAHFGAALARFSADRSPQERTDALQSLFAFHRNRTATWCYLTSQLRTIADPDLLAVLVRALAHLPGHGDILWSHRNVIDERVREQSVALMRSVLGQDEIARLLSAVDENGFERGTIGQAVHCIVSLADNPARHLRSIAFDREAAETLRYTAIFLFVFYAQQQTFEKCVATLEEFRRALPDGEQDEVVVELLRGLREHGHVAFY